MNLPHPITPRDACHIALIDYARTPTPRWFRPIRAVENYSDRATFLYWGSVPLVVCRGTVDRFGWIANLAVWPRPQKGSRTWWHSGFLDSAEQVYDWVQTLEPRPQAIVGHSRGGAIAQIVGSSIPGLQAITLGSPKPLCRPRPSYPLPAYPGQVLNLVADSDLVTRLPLRRRWQRVGKDVQVPIPNRRWHIEHSPEEYLEGLDVMDRERLQAAYDHDRSRRESADVSK